MFAFKENPQAKRCISILDRLRPQSASDENLEEMISSKSSFGPDLGPFWHTGSINSLSVLGLTEFGEIL